VAWRARRNLRPQQSEVSAGARSNQASQRLGDYYIVVGAFDLVENGRQNGTTRRCRKTRDPSQAFSLALIAKGNVAADTRWRGVQTHATSRQRASKQQPSHDHFPHL
jgi:hypothetical protein